MGIEKKTFLLPRKVFLISLVFLIGGIILPLSLINAVAKGNQIASDSSKQKPFSHIYSPYLLELNSSSNKYPHNSSVNNPADFGLSLVITHDPLTFTRGAQASFVITISNTTAVTITDPITLVVDIPSGLANTGLTPDAQLTCDPSNPAQIVCTPLNISSFHISPSKPLTSHFTVDVAPNAPAKITITAKLSRSSLPNTTQSVTDPIKAISIADLEINKTVSKTDPLKGEIITYTLSAKNNGPSNVTDTISTDLLPAGLEFLNATPSGSYDDASGTWTIGNLTSGNETNLAIEARVQSTETITNTATITSATATDPGLSNNTASTTINGQPSPNLSVSLSDGVDYVYPGYIFTYTVSVINQGNAPASNVVITDVLGAGYSIITDTLGITRTSKPNNTFVWDPIPILNAGDSRTFFIRVQTGTSVGSSNNLKNQIIVSTSDPEGNLSDNTAEDINNSINLSISKTVSPSSVNAGAYIKFVITVKNSGTSNATNVVVVDTYPSVLNITRAVTTIGTATINNSNHTINTNVGMLGPNQSVTISIDTVASSNAHGTHSYTNNAIVSATTPSSEPALPDKTSKVSFSVTGSALPPTGGIPLRTTLSFSPIMNLSLIFAIFLILLSLAAILYALFSWKKNAEWAPWFLRTGLILLVSSLVFGSLGGIIYLSSSKKEQTLQKEVQIQGTEFPLSASTSENSTIPNIHFQEPYIPTPGMKVPDELPDYPIPTPSAIPEAKEHVDLSPINRIVIPSIGLDTVVKYVPFSDYTWLIAGLKQEIAWMGNTSWPGLGSNTGLAGHVTLRDGTAGPFYKLDELQPGDSIIIYTDEKVYNYVVREKTKVDDGTLSVVAPTANPQITLITCSDWDDSKRIYTKRLVVFSDLINSSKLETSEKENLPQ